MVSSGERMVSFLPRYLRGFKELTDLLKVVGAEHDTLRSTIQSILDAQLVSVAPEWRLPWFEEEMSLPIGSNLSAADRRSRIIARMQAWQSPSAYNLRTLANAFNNGEVEPVMEPDTYTMHIAFISKYGRPANIDDLQTQMSRVIDAHVAIDFQFKYLLWQDIKSRGVTWAQLKALGITWQQLRSMTPAQLPAAPTTGQAISAAEIRPVLSSDAASIRVTTSAAHTGALVGVDTFNRADTPSSSPTPTDQYGSTTYATPGLVGYWRMGDTSTALARDIFGGHNGTYQGTPTFNVQGIPADAAIDTAVTFNGFDQRVVVPAITNNAALALGNGPFSVEAWVKRAANGANHVIVDKKYSVRINQWDQIELLSRNTASIAYSNVATITDTNWHHVVVTKNGGTVTMYLDGQPITFTFSDYTIVDDGLPFYIGAQDEGEWFNGTIDEVAVYSVVLTAAQVSNHYAKGFSIPNAPVIGAATAIGSSSFTAHWSASVTDATHGAPTAYLLDVSTNSAFSSFVSGYNGVNVGNVTAYIVSGLTASSTYYYRVRATNIAGTSGNSGSSSVTTAAPSQTQTITPTAVPRSAATILNALGTAYKWQGTDVPPDGWRDVFYRDSPVIGWDSIETSQGVYDFSGIDSIIVQARNQGGRAWWRIYTASHTPQYVKNAGVVTWTDPNYGFVVPDYNNSYLWTRFAALQSALANRYNNDPNVGFIEVGSYGFWGENWMDIAGAPAGIAYIDNTHAAQYIDAFDVWTKPLKVIVLGLPSQSGYFTDRFFNKASTNGWRADSWGTSGLGGSSSLLTNWGNRWQTAPVVGEFYDRSKTWADAFTEVQQWHASMVFGNNPSPTGDSTNYHNCQTNCGYRFEITQVIAPTTITPGGVATVSHSWRNVNVAPPYVNWQVKWLLKRSGITTVLGTSALDLRTLIGGGSAATQSDNFTVPGGLTAGSYTLCVRVDDPDAAAAAANNSTLRPMNLAVSLTQDADGAYQICSVTI